MKNLRNYSIALCSLLSIATSNIVVGAQKKSTQPVTVEEMLSLYKNIPDGYIQQELLRMIRIIKADANVGYWLSSTQKELDSLTEKGGLAVKNQNSVNFVLKLRDIYSDIHEAVGSRNQGILNKYRNFLPNLEEALQQVNLSTMLGDIGAKTEFKRIVATALKEGAPLKTISAQLNNLAGKTFTDTPEGKRRQAKIRDIATRLTNIEEGIIRIEKSNPAEMQFIRKTMKEAHEAGEPELKGIVIKALLGYN